ncbi:MAG: hypothetical protein IJ593_00660, partial [Lachnospiraceae bacterium]|nr:hypothetical protein [Lachnospiraceae bacterium]
MEFVSSIQNYFNNTYSSFFIPNIGVKDIIELILLSFIIYYCLSHLSGTRIWVLAKGLMIAAFIYFLAYVFGLEIITIILRFIFILLIATVIIAIQPEIRKFIEDLGNNSLNKSITTIISEIINGKSSETYKLSENTIKELTKGCFKMADVKTGALISISGDIPLKEYIESGIRVDS